MYARESQDQEDDTGNDSEHDCEASDDSTEELLGSEWRAYRGLVLSGDRVV